MRLMGNTKSKSVSLAEQFDSKDVCHIINNKIELSKMQNRKNDCDNSNINALNGLKNTKNLQKSVANYSSSLSLDQQSNQKSSPKTVRFGQKRSSQRESSNFDKSLQMSKNLSRSVSLIAFT